MDVSALLVLVAGKYPVVGLVLGILGCLVVAGQAIVVLTPSKNDDAAWEKIKAMPVIGMLLAALVEFAPLTKK